MEKKLLSVNEAKDILGIGIVGMYNLARTEGFPTIRIGKRILISAEGLDRWITEHTGKQILSNEE